MKYKIKWIDNVSLQSVDSDDVAEDYDNNMVKLLEEVKKFYTHEVGIQPLKFGGAYLEFEAWNEFECEEGKVKEFVEKFLEDEVRVIEVFSVYDAENNVVLTEEDLINL